MPRGPRINIPGVPWHVVHRGNNRAACFFDPADYQRYLNSVGEIAFEEGCALHAYVLMTNHVHLLITPASEAGAARFMKAVAQRHTQYINHRYRRSGSLWEGRYRSALIDSERYALACYQYIELNPVRARMVEYAGEYRWSSFAANAHGAPSALITPHELYLDLGPDQASRCATYRSLFGSFGEPELATQIRAATARNRVLGNSDFQQRIAHEMREKALPPKASNAI